jgi:hypothetical protein
VYSTLRLAVASASVSSASVRSRMVLGSSGPLIKRECLESVAADIPDRLDAYAKRVAQDQPDAARALGPDGIRAPPQGTR